MIGLIESTEQLFHDALETMKKKNADYAGNADSMKNFQISAQVANVKMSQGILTRLTDKTTRIGNLIIKDGAVKDESIFDTVQDLINYAAILHYALQMERREATYKIDEKSPLLGDANIQRVREGRYIVGIDPLTGKDSIFEIPPVPVVRNPTKDVERK